MISSQITFRQSLDCAGLQVLKTPQSLLITDMMGTGIEILKQRRNQLSPIQRTELGCLSDQCGNLRHGGRITEFRKLASAGFRRLFSSMRPSPRCRWVPDKRVRRMKRRAAAGHKGGAALIRPPGEWGAKAKPKARRSRRFFVVSFHPSFSRPPRRGCPTLPHFNFLVLHPAPLCQETGLP